MYSDFLTDLTLFSIQCARAIRSDAAKNKRGVSRNLRLKRYGAFADSKEWSIEFITLRFVNLLPISNISNYFSAITHEIHIQLEFCFYSKVAILHVSMSIFSKYY